MCRLLALPLVPPARDPTAARPRARPPADTNDIRAATSLTTGVPEGELVWELLLCFVSTLCAPRALRALFSEAATCTLSLMLAEKARPGGGGWSSRAEGCCGVKAKSGCPTSQPLGAPAKIPYLLSRRASDHSHNRRRDVWRPAQTAGERQRADADQCRRRDNAAGAAAGPDGGDDSDHADEHGG